MAVWTMASGGIDSQFAIFMKGVAEDDSTSILASGRRRQTFANNSTIPSRQYCGPIEPAYTSSGASSAIPRPARTRERDGASNGWNLRASRPLLTTWNRAASAPAPARWSRTSEALAVRVNTTVALRTISTSTVRMARWRSEDRNSPVNSTRSSIGNPSASKTTGMARIPGASSVASDGMTLRGMTTSMANRRTARRISCPPHAAVKTALRVLG